MHTHGFLVQRGFPRSTARLYAVITIGIAIVLPLRAPAATGLVGYWTFDEGSGTVAADSSGNGNAGTLVNGPAWTSGQINSALQFARSSSQYVNVPDSSVLQIVGSWTVSAWLKMSSAPPDYSMIVAKNGVGTNYSLQVNPSGDVCAYFDNGVAFGPSVCSTPLNLNQWYLGTAVWDSSSRLLSIYVNGQIVASQNVTTMSPDARPGDSLTIGSDAPRFQSGYFTGLIDDVRVYNRALSASEIQQLYAGIH
jgi:hypothetical protein